MQAEVTERLTARFSDAEVAVEVEGNRAVISVVSNEFSGMSRVAKQQAVYACIEDFISDGRLHAVTIRADVPA